jgi:hypothetical protein
MEVLQYSYITGSLVSTAAFNPLPAFNCDGSVTVTRLFEMERSRY